MPTLKGAGGGLGQSLPLWDGADCRPNPALLASAGLGPTKAKAAGVGRRLQNTWEKLWAAG